MFDRDYYKQICLKVGYESASEFFGESKSTTERRANTDTELSIDRHILPLEIHANAWVWTLARFRVWLQRMNRGEDAADVAIIHEALMRIFTRNPKHQEGEQ